MSDFTNVGRRDNSSSKQYDTGIQSEDTSSGSHYLFVIYLSIALVIFVAVVVWSVRKRWNDRTKALQDAHNAYNPVNLCVHLLKLEQLFIVKAYLTTKKPLRL